MYIVGIDPGKLGAAAYLKDGELIAVNAFGGEITNCRRIGAGHHVQPSMVTYFIEKVTASPQMGVVSAFTFGRWAEAVETTAILTGSTVHSVRPQVWQNAIGVFSAGDKKILYDRAQKIFPSGYKMKLFNKATSDAVMIAYYGWRYMLNKKED